jgi:diguanylate cyclase (GGDEF)-like protein
MTLLASRSWSLCAVVAGAALVLVAVWWQSTAGVALGALGGVLVGLAAFRLLATRGAPTDPAGRVSQTESDRLDSMTYALVEGVLDLYSLVEVGRTVNASLHFEQLMTTTLKRIAETTGIESYAFFSLDPGPGTLAVKSVSGAVAQGLGQLTLATHEGLAGRVCRTRTAEAHTGARALEWLDVPRAAKSVFALPLVGRSGVQGALLLYSAAPDAFEKPEQVAYYKTLGRQLSVAFENAAVHSRAMDLSYHDALTDLFNRRYLEEALDSEVSRASRYGLSLSLNMVDIDHFKEYNDTYGHARGDDVLRAVAQRIRDHTRRADILIRYGGEEFVVILPLATKAQARLVAEKLRAAVAATVIDGRNDRSKPAVTVRVGVATYPEDATSAVNLLRAADTALYRAKDRGRNRVEVFDESGRVRS